MKRKVIIKVYFESTDKAKYLEKHSVREWAKILKVSPTYMWEMLCGKKPISEKHYKKIMKYENL